MGRTDGDLIAQLLHAEGVDVVFRVIDGSYVALNGALGQYGIRLISPHHESTAAHMAGASAELAVVADLLQVSANT